VTTVEAASEGEVFAIPRRRLLDLFEKKPLIGFQVYRSAAKVFEHRYRATLDRGFGT
jgi:CRP-like cAMP-binding protein